MRLRRALPAAMLLASIAAATLIAAAPATARPVHALAALGRTKGNAAISATRSATAPHWACPQGACEAIVEPRLFTASGRAESPRRQAVRRQR